MASNTSQSPAHLVPPVAVVVVAAALVVVAVVEAALARRQPPVPVLLPVRRPQFRRQAQRLRQLPVVARLAQLRAVARVAVVAVARAVVADVVPQHRKVRRRPLLVSSC